MEEPSETKQKKNKKTSKNQVEEEQKKSKKASKVAEEENVEENVEEENEAVDEDENYCDFETPSKTGIFSNPKNKVVAFAVFNDGYTIRQLFNLCKNSSKSIPMFFSKKGIYISVGNETATKKANHVTKIFIDKNEIEDYMVDERYWNCESEFAHIINVNQAEFHDRLKGVTKNINMMLYQYENRPDVVFLNFSGDKTNDGGDAVKIDKYEPKIHNVNDGSEPGDVSICNVPLSSFSCACEKSSKFVFSAFRCYDDSMQLVSSDTPLNSSAPTKNARWTKMSKYTVSNKKPFFTTNVTQQILKSFKPYAALSPKGIIKVFCKKDGIIKFEVKLAAIRIMTYVVDASKIDLNKN